MKAHGHHLFYYDNRQRGEVDFLVDDYNKLSILPIEVKSGKDYTVHSALNKMVSVPDYHVLSGLVVSNEREVKQVDKILYIPTYYVVFIDSMGIEDGEIYF